jgi:hypothetical protein
VTNAAVAATISPNSGRLRMSQFSFLITCLCHL